MRYYNYDIQKMLPTQMQEALQKHFPTNDFGVSIVLDNLAGEIDVISVDKCDGSVTGKTTWTHYANLQKCSDGSWEVNSQFKGESEREMWIYKYFKRFADAVRYIASGGIEKDEPIGVYR